MPVLSLFRATSVVAALAFAGAAAAADAPRFGSYEHLFSADSPWNRKPLQPVLGDAQVPKSDYYPTVAEGAWSTGIFAARDDDGPMTVYGMQGKQGVWDPDAQAFRDVVIPHWPRDLAPAAESDGHAEIVDAKLGVVHSFWQLKRDGERWAAAQYAWSRLDGPGWGDPAHYQQGARAAGVPTSGGMIRKQEIDDGTPFFHHALALSLTYNALAAEPPYVYPATSADNDATSTNKGTIPEGSLLMLPPSFDSAKLATPALRKVAETLKTYGAYVVDRNVGTPYVIYVEIGSHYNLHPNGWNNAAASDLDNIRAELRPVVSVAGWTDGNGKAYKPPTTFNILSMRGTWKTQSGRAQAAFDGLSQSVVFTQDGDRTVAVNDGAQGLNGTRWASPATGAPCRVRVTASNGATIHVAFREPGGKVLYDSGELGDGKTVDFKWPTASSVLLTATSGGKGDRSSVRAEILVDLPQAPSPRIAKP